MDLRKFIDDLEARAAVAIKVEPGDYIKDGLLYCHECNTPKQKRLILFNEERTVPCLCQCATERRDAKEAAQRQAAFEERVRKLRAEAFPSDQMCEWTFDNDDRANERISNAMQRYAEHFDEIRKSDINGLVLFGTVGTGKSYYAACVGNALLDRGIAVMMTSFDRIYNKVQESFEGRQAFLDSLNRYPLLIIDDLGAEGSTEFMQKTVFSVIDARAQAGMPLIVTTNLSAEALKKPSDERKQRIYSRLLGMCQPIEVAGPDRRRAKLVEGSKSLKDILGL